MKKSTIKRIVSVMVLLLTLAILLEPRIPIAADDRQESAPGTQNNAPSSLRLIIGTDDNSIKEDEAWISSYNSVHILQFKDEESMQAAVEKYGKSAAFIEADSGISIAEGEAAEHVETDTVMTKEDNPFTELAETQSLYGYDIALIDTGAEGANASVSMIGEAAGDDNGHGTKMLSYIRERDADASILSIKALDAKGVGETSAVYAAIRYAIESKVRMINLSVSALASEDSQIIEAAINEATQSGIVVVGAAGNNNKNAAYYIPGKIDSAIIAGACDGEGQKADVSNYGESVDYNVVSNTTSEAAARLTGILSVMSVEELGNIADKGGVVFHTNYEPQDMPDLPPLMDENGKFTIAASGGAHYLKEFFGITREQFVQFMLKRESDHGYNYYMNTPYGVSWAERDSFYPNGARRSDGYAGMNCAGFIKVAVQDAGGNLYAVYNHCNYSGEDAPWGLAGASVWYKFLAGEGIVWRSYNSRDELINDGWAEKGDIIYCKPTNGGDNHIGFYWGDYPGHNLMWHSYHYGTDAYGNRMGNVIGPLDSKADSLWYVFKWEDVPPAPEPVSEYGYLQVHKDVPGGFSAEGAQYGVYKTRADAASDSSRITTLTIGSGGNSNKYRMQTAYIDPADPASSWSGKTVFIKEVKAPTQRSEFFEWKMDGTVYSATVTSKHTESSPFRVNSENEVSKYGYLELAKASSEPNITEGNSLYSLAGAVYDVYSDAALKNKVGELSTNANGKTDKIKLPVGKYYIKERTGKAPKGYYLNKNSFNAEVKYEQTVTAPTKDVPANDQLLLKIIKESKYDYPRQFPLNDAKFVVRYFDNTDGKTDKAPTRTWTLKTVQYPDGSFAADLSDPACLIEEESQELYTCEGKVTLPLGTIMVEEVSPPMGYTLTGATLVEAGGHVVSTEDGIYIGIIRQEGERAALSYGNIYTMQNTPIELHTTASNAEDDSHYIRKDGKAVIKDTVLFKATDPERLVNRDGEWDYIKYRLKGELRLCGTDEVIASAQKNFVTDDFDGHTEVLEFEVDDISRYKGKTLYVAEQLIRYITKNIDGEKTDVEDVIAIEDEALYPDTPEDLKEKQRIHVPEIKTELKGEEGEKVIYIKQDITLIDTVKYRSLIVGKEYILQGTLMGKKTGKVFLDDDGREVKSEPVRFTAETSDGEVQIRFTFKGIRAARKKLVAFEYLSEEDGTELCTHTDINDEDQSVEVPPVEIKTTLKDKKTKSHIGKNAKTVKLIDTVEYKNLRPGTEYTMKGWLMDKASGKRLKGTDTVSVSFVPAAKKGSVEVEFVFTGKDIAGKSVVAFEELYIGKNLITDHKDLDDPGQTVRFPSVKPPSKEPPTVKPVPTEKESGKPDTTPETGDEQRVYPYVIALLASLAIISAIAIRRVKKKHTR